MSTYLNHVCDYHLLFVNMNNYNYSFYDKDVYVENGTDTYFTAPSSIYPYNRLNINDTTFAYNGAFAGPTPFLADKIFIRRQNTTQYDNGRY